MAVTEGAFDRNATNVSVIYYLYLAAILLGLTAVVGVIMAYMNRGSGADWLETHYRYQIRTFWIGILYVLISSVLTMALVGVLLLVAVLVWWVVRCIKGLKLVGLKQPIPDPATWIW